MRPAVAAAAAALLMPQAGMLGALLLVRPCAAFTAAAAGPRLLRRWRGSSSSNIPQQQQWRSLRSLHRPRAKAQELQRQAQAAARAARSRSVRLAMREVEVEDEEEMSETEDEDLSDEALAKACAERVGEIHIRNSQKEYKIDTEQLERHLQDARDVLGYRGWDINLWLADETAVSELNAQYRDQDKSTDILSFSYNEVEEPGVLAQPRHPEEMDLGEMVVSLTYVDRVIQKDLEEQREAAEAGQQVEWDRGVSGAMSRVHTVQERLPMLCVHGLLHLIGYDHETDDDYQLMVAREEELLQKLKLMPTSM